MAEVPAFFSKLQKECGAVIASVAAKEKLASTLYAGDPYLHWAIGGWSLGKVNILYGPAGSGKSTVALNAIGRAQQKKPGSWVFIIDSELYFVDRPDRIARLNTAFGIDLEHCAIVSTKEINVAFANLFDLIESVKDGEIALAGWLIDSWKGFENKAAVKKILKGEIDDAGNATRGNAKTLNPILDQIVKLAAIARAAVFVTQHVAQNQEEYGPDYLLPGGENLRHQADAIVYLETINASDAKLGDGDTKIAKSDLETEKIGKRIRVKAEKTRNTVEGKKCEVWFNFRDGHFALPEQSLFDLAVRIGVIYHPLNDKGKENNAYWAFDGCEEKFHGQENMVSAIKTNEELRNKIQAACFPQNITDGQKTETPSPKKKEAKNVNAKG
jgi:RecA/RadA recombinase